MRRRLLLGLAWLGVLGAAALAAAVVAGSAHAQSRPCRAAHALAVPNGEHDSKVVLPTLSKANENDALGIPFDDSRDPDSARVPITALNWDPRLVQRYGLELTLGSGYLARAGKNELSATEPGLAGGIVPLGATTFELCLSVAPKQLTSLKPGRYAGNLVVDAWPEAQLLVSVPIELTFRSSRWLAVKIALLGFLLGITVKALSEAAAAQRAGQLGPWQALKAYTSQLDFPLAVLLGAVAGAFVFKQVYVDNPAWGAASGDLMTLFGLCFVAQLSSNEGINLVRRAVTTGPSPHAVTGNL